MKGYSVVEWDDPQNDFHDADQQKGVPPPPFQKEFDRETARVLPLPRFDDRILSESNILKLIKKRRSRRRFASTPLLPEELSYLLWATQGVTKVHNNGSMRTVPSAGGRHPYETYLVVKQVAGIEAGVYRYLPSTHELLFLFNHPSIEEEFYIATHKDRFISTAPVCFIWSCIPYRGEWRYNTKSHKSMLLDAGHICQNLYLAAESIGCGTCAIGGYYQQGMDQMLGLDGNEEFVVYLAPLGKKP